MAYIQVQLVVRKIWYMAPWAQANTRPNSISIGSAVFAVLPNMDNSIVFTRLYQCASPCSMCALGPRVHNPNGTSIDSVIFAQLMAQCCQHAHAGLFAKDCTFAWGNLVPI